MPNELISFRADRKIKEGLRALAAERFGDPSKIGPLLLPEIIQDLREAGLLKETKSASRR